MKPSFLDHPDLFSPLDMASFLLSLSPLEAIILLPFGLFLFALPALLLLENSARHTSPHRLYRPAVYLGLSLSALLATLIAPSILFTLDGLTDLRLNAPLMIALLFSLSCLFQAPMAAHLASFRRT